MVNVISISSSPKTLRTVIIGKQWLLKRHIGPQTSRQVLEQFSQKLVMESSASQPFCTCPVEKTAVDRWGGAGSRTQPGLRGIGPGEAVTKQNGSDLSPPSHLPRAPERQAVHEPLHCQRQNAVQSTRESYSLVIITLLPCPRPNKQVPGSHSLRVYRTGV